MSNPIDERRAHPRFATELKLEASPEAGGSEARMIASDLSLGGLRCFSSIDFPEMTRLAVRLMLPIEGSTNGDLDPVDLEAVVVRRQPAASATGSPRFELALFFVQLADETRSRLAGFIGDETLTQ